MYIQNKTGNSPKTWQMTGVIVEKDYFNKYTIKMDGRGRMMLRKRRFLRLLQSYKKVISRPQQPDDSGEQDQKTDSSPTAPRRSSRISKKQSEHGDLQEDSAVPPTNRRNLA